MFNSNKMNLITMFSGEKTPLDAKIVGWLVLISALMHFITVGLLLSGIAHAPLNCSGDVLFRTFSLASDLSVGIYSFLKGAVCLICAYGLIRGYKFGWWLMLISSINNVSDCLLRFSDYRITATISICISLGIIGWLIYRRHLYSIGGRN